MGEAEVPGAGGGVTGSTADCGSASSGSTPGLLMEAEEFDIIVADPPWRYSFSRSRSRRIERRYSTMTAWEIAEVEIPAAENALLFLWVPSPKLETGIVTMGDWGFQYITCAVWKKHRIGMGYWWRQQHELVLLGKRGKFSPPPPALRRSSIIAARARAHSQKPEELQDWIDEAWPEARKLEMFARRPREGWTVRGNEVEA